MSSSSSIEWTDATWNPVTGCDRVSPGCAHCYALDLAGRLKAMGQPKYQRDGDPQTSGPGFGVTLHEHELEVPLRWRRPRMVFVNSMSDLFHEDVPGQFINRVWMTMFNAPRHTYQVLTKRPERLLEWTRIAAAAKCWPIEEIWPPWVWLGVSIENRRYVHRADVLRETPTSGVRFISAEPLLGPLLNHREVGRCTAWDDGYVGPSLSLDGIDWLIVGGESGRQHRPIEWSWVYDLQTMAELQEVPFFFKQWGGRTPKAGGRLLDGREWNEMPRQAESVAA